LSQGIYKSFFRASFWAVIMEEVFSRMTRSSRIALVGVLLAGTLPLFGANDHKGVNLYSVPQEISLGRQMAAEVEKQAHMIEDPIIAEYVNRLGQNLALQANADFPVRVKMIQSDEINAFTLPGGFVYVNSAVMKMADNEAQLASVIAHEIGHAAARHATRQATRGQLAKFATAPLAILIPGWGGLAAQQTARAAAPVASLHYSRAFETEADLLGVRYLSGAGYDPNASVDMFERIQSTERNKPGAVSKLFLSHPPTGDRIAKTQTAIGKLKGERDSYILNTSEFEAVRTRLMSGQN
jgi:predicted Zn-dependent protease